MTPTPERTGHAGHVPSGFPSDADALDLVRPWIVSQRWFTGKGGTEASSAPAEPGEPAETSNGDSRTPRGPSGPALEIVGTIDLPGLVPVRDLLVRDMTSDPVLYQVPITVRGPESARLPGLSDALIGTIGEVHVYDAAADPEGARTLLTAVLEERSGSGQSATDRATSASGHRATGGGALAGLEDASAVTGARLLTGEQSNSSIVYTTTRGPDVIGKIFRMLHAGVNPDVEVQRSLAAGGCTLVPAPVGDLMGTWEDEDDEDVTGHLFFAQEYIAGAQDAWKVALAAAAEGRPFEEAARALGRATAEVHAVLAEHMPSYPADTDQQRSALESWVRRLDAAIAAVPELAASRDAALDVFAAAMEEEWPELQRVHGDFHLGQVLDVPDRGWVLLDFEGEPLRPLAERTEPDLAPRDVAGMLRSFDYAAGSVDHPQAGRWAAGARAAFLDGYSDVAPPVADPHRLRNLLGALELDKALYEVVYEVRNRPDWVHIPLGGVRRLLADHG